MADADRPTDHSLSLVNDTEGNNVIHKHELPHWFKLGEKNLPDSESCPIIALSLASALGCNVKNNDRMVDPD